jgi:hypothetical protein
VCGAAFPQVGVERCAPSYHLSSGPSLLRRSAHQGQLESETHEPSGEFDTASRRSFKLLSILITQRGRNESRDPHELVDRLVLRPVPRRQAQFEEVAMTPAQIPPHADESLSSNR